VSLDALLDGSPNPLAPTVRETIEHALGEEERRRFLAHLREAFRAGATSRWAGAYLTARRAG